MADVAPNEMAWDDFSGDRSFLVQDRPSENPDALVERLLIASGPKIAPVDFAEQLAASESRPEDAVSVEHALAVRRGLAADR